MDTNPAANPALAMHTLKFTSDQLLLVWQLTEMAKPNGGPSADLLTSVRNRLRVPMAKVKKSIEALAASQAGNGQLVASGRRT